MSSYRPSSKKVLKGGDKTQRQKWGERNSENKGHMDRQRRRQQGKGQIKHKSL